MSSPSISVILPCYNVERWLPRCLDEVFAALPPEAEVLAVDDESADSTLAILRKRAQEDSRLQVIAARHGGLSAARNRGLDVARGRYVFFVDADDGVASDYFTAMIAAMERDRADCCICAISECPDGTADVHEHPLKGDYRYQSNAEVVSKYLPRIFGYSFEDVRAWYRGRPLFAERELASVCRMAYRRELIEAYRLRFREEVTYFEDMVFNAEYFLRASSMTAVNRPLYHITSRESGLQGTVPKDGARYCRNKLVLLRRRDAINRLADGILTPLYAGTNVLAALEILFYIARRRIAPAEGWRILREYLATPSVRVAIRGFPLTVRRPVLALSVLALRGFVRCGTRRKLL